MPLNAVGWKIGFEFIFKSVEQSCIVIGRVIIVDFL